MSTIASFPFGREVFVARVSFMNNWYAVSAYAGRFGSFSRLPRALRPSFVSLGASSPSAAAQAAASFSWAWAVASAASRIAASTSADIGGEAILPCLRLREVVCGSRCWGWIGGVGRCRAAFERDAIVLLGADRVRVRP